MRRLGAMLFIVAMRGSMIVMLLFMWLGLPFGWQGILAFVRGWARMMRVLLRGLCGVDDSFRGLVNLPAGPCILAVKHQAEWETFVLHLLRDDLAFVLKKELMEIPVWGTYSKVAGNIAVDRKAGASALRKMTEDARAAIAAGRSIVIFPEGTRTVPGADARYHPGVAALYQALDVPVVPVALNSGLFWPRGGRPKRSGTIVVEVLEPIEPGLERRTFMDRLRAAIETATDRLVAEAGGPLPGAAGGRPAP